MFSEYMETQEPIKEKELNKELSSDKENWWKDEKDDSKKEKLSEEEQNLQNSKKKLNERYDVMSNAYPNWSFEKILSTDENDDRQTKLDISRWEWWTFFSVNMSEMVKWEDWKQILDKSLTLNFIDFAENIPWDSASFNREQNEKQQVPNVAINWDISMLSNLVETENWNWQNIFDTGLLDINSINGKNEIINYVDKNIMKAPIDSVYWYANKQFVENMLEEIKLNQKDTQEEKQIDNNDITDYILNSVDKESISVYKKDVFDVMICLGIILRNSSNQEMSQLRENNQDEDNKSLLTSISSISSWENIIEYLSSNLDFFLNKKDDLKNQVLKNYENEMTMEEFNFLVP